MNLEKSQKPSGEEVTDWEAKVSRHELDVNQENESYKSHFEEVIDALNGVESELHDFDTALKYLGEHENAPSESEIEIEKARKIQAEMLQKIAELEGILKTISPS